MAQNKNHHFVPKCHFKPFSLNEEGLCVHAYHAPSGKVIKNASISGQCSKNYFYGEDNKLETALQGMEGLHATAIRNIQSRNGKSKDDELFSFLRFTLLQHLRTEQAMRRIQQAQQQLIDTAFAGEAGQVHKPPPLSQREILRMAMVILKDAADVVDDLKTVVVRNESDVEFITSDDPAIHTNRYHIQRLGRTNFGLSNSGAMLLLPLSPKFLFLAYDGGCYTIPDKVGTIVSLSSRSDIQGLNRLQILNCASCLFFSNINMADEVQEQFKENQKSRISTWSAIEELVEFAEGKYRAVVSSEESAASEMLHTSALFPVPSGWPSFLKFRNPVRVVDTGTGAGIRRR
ncbi:DUF4238 domain-containing protein [Mesorhizobium sp. CO1-1-8]|uniref:DUF4238 domain-containing protein n=1 Tax=Mesorhizobium sp. CO1-1-8 TaxID=2876631 RepID=UPI001CD16CFD|nr:DUF4238 domain-containing protein [Mesorhizobium sp. CO1-1-8]MBZ9774383.1 DUF4238 domain-containing protein [Mesorhizobium sp. CO1-1-8]